jgi:N6-L-threonylcarbamoyladenine synthase
MLVLGIESSCDETAAAVLEDGTKVISQVVASQVRDHAPYGGVVPELASRRHLEAMVPVIARTMEEAGIQFTDLAGVAVTQGPGLVGSLVVGITAAKAIAAACHLPLVGVNHLDGHLYSIFLEAFPPFPYICLTVSGGHTALYRISGFMERELLGQTRDDAAGEAFDKVAKLLGLGYPGGVAIENLAVAGDPAAIPFPRAYIDQGSLDFSFSGLKTAVAQFVKACPPPWPAADIAASFQEAVTEVLVEKAWRAIQKHGGSALVLAGGVASNGYIRKRFQEAAGEAGVSLFIPSPAYCTDNAAMIALVGTKLLVAGKRSGLDLEALSRWP